eukprot:4781026-Prymnesium_polylepis.1
MSRGPQLVRFGAATRVCTRADEAWVDSWRRTRQVPDLNDRSSTRAGRADFARGVMRYRDCMRPSDLFRARASAAGRTSRRPACLEGLLPWACQDCSPRNCGRPENAC